MKRSGGRAGRPFGQLTIVQLEQHVAASKSDFSELTAILAELGHRTTKRALALKDLVNRLLRSLSDAPPTKSRLAVSASPMWRMEVEQSDLVAAIGTARRRPTLRRVAGAPGGFEIDAFFSGWEFGLSIRSSESAMDIDGRGIWASPIRVNGAALRRLAPKLANGRVLIEFADGRLKIAGTEFPASEV